MSGRNGKRKAKTETVHARIKRLRLERGMSQREMASAGVSYAYISRIEAGKRQPSVRALRRIAERLDVSPEYLEFGDEVSPTIRAYEQKIEDLELDRAKLREKLQKEKDRVTVLRKEIRLALREIDSGQSTRTKERV